MHDADSGKHLDDLSIQKITVANGKSEQKSADSSAVYRLQTLLKQFQQATLQSIEISAFRHPAQTVNAIDGSDA